MDYSQFLLLKEELSLILVIVILFVADLFMSPDAHKNDGKPVLNTMLPVALLTIHTLITIVPGPVAYSAAVLLLVCLLSLSKQIYCRLCLAVTVNLLCRSLPQLLQLIVLMLLMMLVRLPWNT